ncbi:MAG: SBBP repeat-containing protein, partial [Acidobacteria bacterium]|nr:SBBP repeat-containing protein [Acidobacteriota bacterium]
MRSQRRILIVFLALAGSILPAAFASSRVEAERALASVPAWFEASAGRYAPGVKYVSHHGSGTLLVGASGATFRDRQGTLSFAFLGANSHGRVEGVEATGSRSSYLLGNDRRQWKHGIAHYAKVRASAVYPGVDVIYYLSGRHLEFDLLVAPGADAGQIRLAFEGAGKPKLDRDGNLEFANGMRQQRPVAYQDGEAGKQAVDARYVLARNGEIRLALGSYDTRRALVIDPILHVGYLGGDLGDIAKAIAVDRQGNVWVTGSSGSTLELPAQVEPIQERPAGGKDVFVAKFKPDAAGKLTLAYWTQLGGSAEDVAEAITVDSAGFVYLAGSTASSDFPGAGAKLQDAHKGNLDAFVVKIWPGDAGTAALWFSQVYGGTGLDVAYAIAVDSANNIYFAGYTLSIDLPLAAATPAQAANRDGYEGFLVQVNPAASTPLAYATYLGGRGTDVITAIAVAAPGDVYLAGYTASDNFPVTDDAYQWNMRSTLDAFLVRLDLNRTGQDA